VQAVDPAARVVYIDHDPMVLAYADDLLTPDGTTAVIQADLRDPDTMLGHPALRALVNFGEPAGLLMTAVLQFVADSSDPWGLVARYAGALAPGSYLVSHTGDGCPTRIGPASTLTSATEHATTVVCGDRVALDGLELSLAWRRLPDRHARRVVGSRGFRSRTATPARAVLRRGARRERIPPSKTARRGGPP
jgi:hypothetical protein